MYDREVLELFIANGLRHILISRPRQVLCHGCGSEVQTPSFFSLDGEIIRVGESMIVLQDLGNEIRTIRNEDIVSIDVFRQEIAKRNERESS